MNNKVPQLNFVFDRRKTASLDRKASVELRITHDYKQKYISTGIMLYSNQWKDGKIVNCPDILEISQTLDKMLTDVRQIILDMLKNNSLNIKAVSDELDRRRRSRLSFVDFCYQRAAIRKFKKSPDSQERYDRFLKHFVKWGKIKVFEDINDKNTISYDKYLDSTGMKSYSKWNNYHRFLNSFILDAIDEGYIKRNPYKWVRIEKEKSKGGIGKYLSPQEFAKVRDMELPTESLQRVRDLFVFQTYTCLSYVDLSTFDAEKIEKVKGMKVYIGTRAKTSQTFTIPLLKPALAILKKYNNHLPIISNVKFNEYLKVVAQNASIDKPVSSHWARHTGATLLLNSGDVPMNIVQHILGHASQRMTEQVYAKRLDESIVDAMAKIDGKI